MNIVPWSGSTYIKLTVYIGTLSGFTHIRLTVRSAGVSQMQSLPPNVAGGVVYQPGAPPSYPGTFSPAGSVEGSPMHNVYMGQPGQNPPGQYQAMPPAGEDADPPPGLWNGCHGSTPSPHVNTIRDLITQHASCQSAWFTRFSFCV